MLIYNICIVYCMRNTSPIIPILLEYSAASNWDAAKLEWKLNEIEIRDDANAETCACGHYPIHELCIIENKITRIVLIVGNCCVNQISSEFEELNKIFNAIKQNRINLAVIDYANKQNIINQWETSFLKNVWRKRNLSKKQSIKVEQIKMKIFKNIK